MLRFVFSFFGEEVLQALDGEYFGRHVAPGSRLFCFKWHARWDIQDEHI